MATIIYLNDNGESQVAKHILLKWEKKEIAMQEH